MSIGAEWYLLELLQFILNPSWLCNMETDRALAQNAELVWLDAVQYPENHGAVCRPKQTASLFISRKMENLEQTVPAFWPREIIWSGPFSVFLFPPPKPHTTHCSPMLTSLPTLKQTYWMVWGFGYCLGSFSETTLCELGH